jgi:hypothetical protein
MNVPKPLFEGVAALPGPSSYGGYASSGMEIRQGHFYWKFCNSWSLI